MKQYSPLVIDFIWFCINQLGDDAADIKKTLDCTDAEARNVFKQALKKYKKCHDTTAHETIERTPSHIIRPQAQYTNAQFNI